MRNRKAEVLLDALSKAQNGLWIEIGCIREDKEVPTDGFSTYYLAKMANIRNCLFRSYDTNHENVEMAKRALEKHHLLNINAQVYRMDGETALKYRAAEKEEISFLYLDSHRLPIYSAAQYLAAPLAEGAVVVIDDCHSFDGFEYGKGNILVSLFEKHDIEWEIFDTEPGFRMIVAYLPNGKKSGEAK